MCGIIGYAGHRPAVPVVIEGLRRLEYRGYDSAGVACVQRGELCITRAQGKLSALEEKLANTTFVRISKNCIVNTAWLKSVSPLWNHRLEALLKNGDY